MERMKTTKLILSKLKIWKLKKSLNKLERLPMMNIMMFLLIKRLQTKERTKVMKFLLCKKSSMLRNMRTQKKTKNKLQNSLSNR